MDPEQTCRFAEHIASVGADQWRDRLPEFVREVVGVPREPPTIKVDRDMGRMEIVCKMHDNGLTAEYRIPVSHRGTGAEMVHVAIEALSEKYTKWAMSVHGGVPDGCLPVWDDEYIEGE